MRLPYRSAFDAPLVRIRVTPDDPRAIVGPRPRGSRRPHTDASVAQVRRLIEQTTLTYSEIAQKTGIGRASICRWTRDQAWQRPVFAPRATDTVPRARASARLKLRTLFARLSALAERHVRELEESGCVDPDKLAEALALLKMAKFAARPKKRRARGTPRVAPWEEPARVLARLQNAGVDLNRAPAQALRDVIDSHAPPRDFPELRPRGKKSRRNREHARLLERER
jgi:transcriptional regulator with XRE-family HTH domain